MFPDDFLEEYQGIMQSIELMVVGYYRDNPTLVDHNVEKIYNGLQRLFDKENQGKNPPKLRFNELEQLLFDQIEMICRMFLGEIKIEPEDDGEKVDLSDFEPIDKANIVQIMKRLRKSIKTWTGNVHGQRGYLDYISQFM